MKFSEGSDIPGIKDGGVHFAELSTGCFRVMGCSSSGLDFSFKRDLFKYGADVDAAFDST